MLRLPRAASRCESAGSVAGRVCANALDIERSSESVVTGIRITLCYFSKGMALDFARVYSPRRHDYSDAIQPGTVFGGDFHSDGAIGACADDAFDTPAAAGLSARG